MYKKKYQPHSVPFIICLLFLNLFIVGLIYLIAVGFIKFNWFYIFIGIIGDIFLILTEVNLLSLKIILYDKYIYCSKSLFNKFFSKENKEQQIYYQDISNITLEKMPTQIIKIYCKNINQPYIFYVKQFSKKQILNMIEEIQKRGGLQNQEIKLSK